MIAAGQSIGNYRILNKIGTGGMGAVYLAEHPLIGKRVALKVIHRELAGNREVVSRFFQEARAVNKIGNEHIVEIHDFGMTPEGDHFYIMEYLEGRTLASVLSHDGGFEVMRSLHIGAQIAHALAAAHVAGIVHRDLKPDNIMLMARLGDQDFVKVLDFGLAKVFSAATAVQTAAGVLLGTPQYMSPEACESKRDIDHRTDIYALGVLLFQMMTGALPFDGESMGEVLIKQVTALPPAPRGLNPAIPPSVEQILLRCLAKPVDARFATMLQLREALLDPEAYLRGSPPIAPARAGGGAPLVTGEARTMPVQIGPGPAHAHGQGAGVGAGPAAALPPAMQKTRLATANLPLPAPMPSIMGGGSAAGGGLGGLGGGGGPGSPTAAASAPTMISDHAPVRRASSAMPALAPPQEPKMNTMRIATPLGYSSRPPRRVWPVVLGAALLLGVGGGVLSVTCFGRDNVARSGQAEARPGGGSDGSAGSPGSGEPAAVGAMAAAGSAGSMGPVGSAGTTGSLGTTGSASEASDPGASDIVASAPRPSRRPPTFSDTPTPTAPPTATSPPPANPTSTAPPTPVPTSPSRAPPTSTAPATPTSTPPAPPPPAAPPAPPFRAATPPAPSPPATAHTAHLTIESVPTGASVRGPRGEALGKTPVALDWPTSDAPVAFELRLVGYRAKQKQTVINGNTRLVIELERAPARRPTGAAPSKSRSTDNGLMRPDE